MVCRYEKQEIFDMLLRQIHNVYFKRDTDIELLEQYYDLVIERVSYCFSNNSNKYYSCELGGGYFDALHSCQWLIFLYYYANTLYKKETKMRREARELCDRIYGISKMMSGADLYYEVDMPDIFICDHPVGSVIGRASFGNYFLFANGCTVGNSHGIYPVIGEHVTLYAGSKIIGKSKIGNNVIVSVNTYIKNQDVPDNTLVFGASPNLIFKPKREGESYGNNSFLGRKTNI